MIRACFHLLPNCQSSLVQWAAAGAPSVKLCNPDFIAPAYGAGAKHVYYRPYLTGDDGGCADGTAWAAQVVTAIMDNGGVWPDAVGFRNEMPATPEDAKQYAYYRIFLRGAGFRGDVVLGSFSVGNPNLARWGADQWSPMFAAIKAVDPQHPLPDAVDLHEYFDLTVAGCSPLYTLRHVQAISDGALPASIPIYLGEYGSDALTNAQGHPVQDAQGRRGWNDRGKLTAAQMTAQLAAYLSGCAPSVRHAYLFVDGNTGDPKWQSYFSRGTPVETAIRQTWQEGSAGVNGIDVSVWQGAINWPQVAAGGAAFAIARATHGTTTDGTFADNWTGIKAANLVRGAYSYCENGDPLAEAEAFLAAVGTWETGDIPCLDLEQGSGDLSSWAINWASVVTAKLGTKPLLYANEDYVLHHGLGAPSVVAAFSGLWLATGGSPLPSFPLGAWPRASIWQSGVGASPGVAGACDVDVAYVDLGGLGMPAATVPTSTKLAYFQQLGVKLDVSHAVWGVTLSPLYDRWQQAVAQNDPLADVLCPGPAVAPEQATTWGGSRPAGVVKTQNAYLGAYLGTDGHWHAYRQALP